MTSIAAMIAVAAGGSILLVGLAVWRMVCRFLQPHRVLALVEKPAWKWPAGFRPRGGTGRS